MAMYGRYRVQLGLRAGSIWQLCLQGCVLIRTWVGEEKEVAKEVPKPNKYA